MEQSGLMHIYLPVFTTVPHGTLRQHRTEIVVQMRSQIFRQIVHKFRRHTNVCQGICVQDAGKYASRCATKPSGGLCAVLP